MDIITNETEEKINIEDSKDLKMETTVSSSILVYL